MYYGLVLLSTLLFSLQFLFQQKYNNKCGNDMYASLNYSFLTGVIGLVLIIIINGPVFEFTLFSGITAFFYAAAVVGFFCSMVMAFTYGNLSVCTMFAMLGGMVLPFLFGVLYKGEELTWQMILCFILIAIALFFSVEKGKSSKKAIKYYIAVFFFNGLNAVVQSFHQMYEEYNISSNGFMILARTMMSLLSLALIMLGKKKRIQCDKKIIVYTSGGAVVETLANLFLLIALLYIPTSVQFTLVTGGTIVFSTVIAFLTPNNKPSRREIIATIIAVVASAVLVL